MKRLFAIVCAVLMGIPAMAEKVEEPAWKLVDTLGEVEIRRYGPLIQARTPIPEGGFRELAGYIFGGNEREQSIAMTAPVAQTLTEQGAYMAFNMPSQYRMEELPSPSDDSVTLHRVPARTVGVLGFSGWATDGKVARKVDELLTILETRGVEAVGAPSLNQYNPPWTPPWMRRNEVVVEVAWEEVAGE